MRGASAGSLVQVAVVADVEGLTGLEGFSRGDGAGGSLVDRGFSSDGGPAELCQRGVFYRGCGAGGGPSEGVWMGS